MSELLKETLELDIDESNELQFKVVVEGSGESPSVRLVCEGNEMSYMFRGKLTSDKDVVQFNLPEMKNRLQEGTYNAKVEVLVGNRYFTPVEFDIHFKKQLTVFAESITHKQSTPVKQQQKQPQVTVSAIPTLVQKVKQERVQEQAPTRTSSLEESRQRRKLVEEIKQQMKNKPKSEIQEWLKSIED